MQDRLVDAHARLSALKSQLPETSTVEVRHVREFHDILHTLEQVSGCDLGEYRVPSAQVTLRSSNGDGHATNGNAAGGNGLDANSAGGAGNGHDGETWCALEPACDRHALLARIDGVLTFFGIQATRHRN